MRRSSLRNERAKTDYKVSKKCIECEKEIPVACKTCPLCKSPVVPTRPTRSSTAAEEEEKETSKIRRTERVRRERPDFFNSLELDNQFKKKRKRKESTASISSIGKPATEPEPCASPTSDSPNKKRRGRPKSITTQESCDKESTPTEEEFSYTLPPEKFLQYTVLLAEINRKFSTQNFKPL